MMLKKYYTYDVVQNGTILGSGLTWVWIWVSPLAAYKIASATLSDYGVKQTNFRRIK